MTVCPYSEFTSVSVVSVLLSLLTFEGFQINDIIIRHIAATKIVKIDFFISICASYIPSARRFCVFVVILSASRNPIVKFLNSREL